MNRIQRHKADEVFDLFLRECLDLLKYGEERVNPLTGAVIRTRPSAAKLARIQRFLEENRIGQDDGQQAGGTVRGLLDDIRKQRGTSEAGTGEPE